MPDLAIAIAAVVSVVVANKGNYIHDFLLPPIHVETGYFQPSNRVSKPIRARLTVGNKNGRPATVPFGAFPIGVVKMEPFSDETKPRRLRPHMFCERLSLGAGEDEGDAVPVFCQLL